MATLITPPALNDYEFSWNGVLLNGSSMPIWDVEKLTGLVDLPEVPAEILDYDGRDGSSIYSRYVKHRTIIIEGTLYASTATSLEDTIDTMMAAVNPTGVKIPFFFKRPGKSSMYCLCDVLGFNSDLDQLRRTAKAPWQLQLGAGDRVKYIDVGNTAWTTNVNFNLTNAGNAVTYPEVNITANATTTADVTITNNTTGISLVLSVAVTSGQVLSVDLANLTVKVAGVIKNTGLTLTTANWPSQGTGVTSWKVISDIGNGTIFTRSGWL